MTTKQQEELLGGSNSLETYGTLKQVLTTLEGGNWQAATNSNGQFLHKSKGKGNLQFVMVHPQKGKKFIRLSKNVAKALGLGDLEPAGLLLQPVYRAEGVDRITGETFPIISVGIEGEEFTAIGSAIDAMQNASIEILENELDTVE